MWICDSDGGKCSELTTLGRRYFGPARWSPDGKWIAFTHASEPPGDPGIDLVRVDGGVVRTLIDGKQLRSINPGWSPDGQWIYFNFVSGDSPGRFPIWRIPSAGGTPQPAGTLAGRRPGFGADGRYVYYMKGSAPRFSIWRAELATGLERMVLDVTPAGGWTLWQQTLIYAAVDAQQRSFIAQLDFETGKTTELTSLGETVSTGRT